MNENGEFNQVIGQFESMLKNLHELKKKQDSKIQNLEEEKRKNEETILQQKRRILCLQKYVKLQNSTTKNLSRNGTTSRRKSKSRSTSSEPKSEKSRRKVLSNHRIKKKTKKDFVEFYRRYRIPKNESNFRKHIHRYEDVDFHALHLPKYETLEKTVKNLIIHETEQELIARSIFTWIVRNIEWKALEKRGQKQPHFPEDVFREGVAVCSGFSCLAERMLSLSGIPSERISGIMKRISDPPGMDLTPRASNPGHSWNVVKIDGLFYFIDTSSASCESRNKDENGETYFENLEDYFFFTPPKKLIHSHWTEKYQFLDPKNRISRKEFEKRVMVSTCGIRKNISNLSHNNGKIFLSEGEERLTVTFSLDLAPDKSVCSKLQYYREGVENHDDEIEGFTYHEVLGDGKCTVEVRFPENKKVYDLYIYWGPKESRDEKNIVVPILRYLVYVGVLRRMKLKKIQNQVKKRDPLFKKIRNQVILASPYDVALMGRYQLLEGREFDLLEYERCGEKKYLYRMKLKIPVTTKKKVLICQKISEDEDKDTVVEQSNGNIYEESFELEKSLLKLTLYIEKEPGSNDYSGIYTFDFVKLKKFLSL